MSGLTVCLLIIALFLLVVRYKRVALIIGCVALLSLFGCRHADDTKRPIQAVAAVTVPVADNTAVDTIISKKLTKCVYYCGAKTKKGTPCKHRVKILGAKCPQHRSLQKINAVLTKQKKGQYMKNLRQLFENINQLYSEVVGTDTIINHISSKNQWLVFRLVVNPKGGGVARAAEMQQLNF